ncbi:MAG: chemotaxis protein CheW [Coriobacteriia bacterium]|nr:chemotaxis protein CheW [Coriobacteriia bacterium]
MTKKRAGSAAVEDAMSSAAAAAMTHFEAETMQLVTFLLGEDEYGFHIEHVQEIIRLRHVHITAIPNAPTFVEGVINLRGRLVPAVDLRKRFGRPTEMTGRAARIVVVNVLGRTVGLVVDAVLEVAKVGTLEVEQLPELAAGVGSEFVEGVCRIDRGLVVVLDLERMFSEEETGAITDIAE